MVGGDKTARSLQILGLSKSYGSRRVLNEVSLEVKAGEVAFVLGESGSGKTTLLRLIAGFDQPDQGSISIDDTPVVSCGGTPEMANGIGRQIFVAPSRRGVGYLPQEGALFPHLDVQGNIGFGLKSIPNKKERLDVIEATLLLVGLDRTFLSKRPSQLSGGEQRRVALARALAPGPGLIVLDEPFTGLDTRLREDVAPSVIDVLRTAGTTAVIVTHDQGEALGLGDKVAILSSGSIVQFGTPNEVYNFPRSLEVARLVGPTNEFTGHFITRTELATPVGNVQVDAQERNSHDSGKTDPTVRGPAVEVMLRPDQLRISVLNNGGKSEQKRDPSKEVQATVLRVYFMGGRSKATLLVGQASQVEAQNHDEVTSQISDDPHTGCEIVVQVDSTMGIKPGDRVRVEVVGQGLVFSN